MSSLGNGGDAQLNRKLGGAQAVGVLPQACRVFLASSVLTKELQGLED